MRHSWLLLVLCLAIPSIGIPTIGIAADGLRVSKRPLDLPSGGRSAKDADEEDAPESIVFYGSEFEGDCFVWCFPAYGFCGDTTVFTAIRAELTAAISQLSDQSKFDLVAFNSTSFAWNPMVQAANAGNRASAVAWMNTLTPVESHNIADAAVTALGISQASDSNHKQMVLCGARAPIDIPDALITITSANYESTPLHTIYFSTPFYYGEEAFYQELSAMNGGTFRQVTY
jgi:hypothetical protein